MNTLSKDVEIKGSITFAHQLIIEGKVDGDVISQGDLTIGESGAIKGRITAKNVVIFGKVEGNVTAQERCQARATATIHGDVTAGAFAAEEGATFMGRSRVGKNAPAPAPTPTPAPAAKPANQAPANQAPANQSSGNQAAANQSGAVRK